MSPIGYGTDLGNVSTLDDVVAYVVALFGAIAPTDPTCITVGDTYNKNDGAPPRVHIVIGDGGKLGPVLEVGAHQIAGVTERCTCAIWGDPAAKDVDDNRAAKALAVRVMNAFKMATVGRALGAQLTRNDKTKIAKWGQEYTLVIDYTWAVPRDKAIDAAATALGTPRPTPPDPDRPDGVGTGAVYGITVTNANTRP